MEQNIGSREGVKKAVMDVLRTDWVAAILPLQSDYCRRRQPSPQSCFNSGL